MLTWLVTGPVRREKRRDELCKYIRKPTVNSCCQLLITADSSSSNLSEPWKKKKRKTPHKHPYMYESQDNTLQYIGLCSDIFLILNQFILLTLHLLHIFSCKLTLCKQYCLFLCLDIDGEWAVSCSCLSVVCTVSWHHMTRMHSWLLCSCKDSAVTEHQSERSILCRGTIHFHYCWQWWSLHLCWGDRRCSVERKL